MKNFKTWLESSNPYKSGALSVGSDVSFLKKAWNMPIGELEEWIPEIEKDYKFAVEQARNKSVVRVLYKKDVLWLRTRLKLAKQVLSKLNKGQEVPAFVNK